MNIELKQAAQQALSALEKSQPHPSNPVIGLTNQDFIDHEETIRQLRTAIQQAEAQQPATGEAVAWNSIQIASWIGSQLMHEPSMFERATVCKFVRSLGRHPTLLKHSPKNHPASSAPADVVRDAERYRWLKEIGVGHWESDDHFTWLCDLDADEAIDAAMLAAAPHPQQPKEPS